MAHISLQMGTSVEEKDCPNLRCVVDTGAALSTANFHYMEAVICQYPHILKQVYLPANYAAIILSGIVTSSDDSPIMTELPVGFKIHLNYLTKDGSATSLLVTAGPDVAGNLILGLPFIKATGLICDFVDNVCQAKHLLCDPFPIDFKRAWSLALSAMSTIHRTLSASWLLSELVSLVIPMRTKRLFISLDLKSNLVIDGFLPCLRTPLHLRIQMIIIIRSWGT
jgi:hypothetical protein